MSANLAELLDAAEFDGLAIDKQPTGFTASIDQSPREFASSASDAVAKCLRLHGRVRVVAVAPVLAPPPY